MFDSIKIAPMHTRKNALYIGFLTILCYIKALIQTAISPVPRLFQYA